MSNLNFIMSTMLVHMRGLWHLLANLPNTITLLRILGGSAGMWTFFEGKLPPEAATNLELAKKLNILNDKQINDYCAFVQSKNLGTLYMMNSNDTVANSVWILQKFVDGGANIKQVEIGQELYLSKFESDEIKLEQGHIRKVTFADYAAYCLEIIPLIKQMLPEAKILLHIAYEGGGPKSVQRRKAWNNNIEQAIAAHPNMVDGLVVHLYEGKGASTNQGEEIAFDQVDFSQLDRWNMPLYWTETGNVLVDYTEQGLSIYRDYLRRIYEYCLSRGDGSVPGAQVLLLRRAGKGHSIYCALYNEDGETPLAAQMRGYPWNDEFGTVEPPVTPGPPIEPQPPTEAPYLTEITYTFTGFIGKQYVFFSDGSHGFTAPRRKPGALTQKDIDNKLLKSQIKMDS